ncbi:hypothetical protein BDZ89DRAFT_1158386 [Hymenopellis radicata]|nr:hypothetical protein BDZ89DRAFT_1158386 [Hymenopellis radicata]
MRLAVLALVAVSVSVSAGTVRRQNDVPPECQASCAVADPLTDGTCTLDVCCTSDFANSYVECIECVGNKVGATDYTNFQGILDSLKVQCDAENLPIPKLTFPGQDPDRPLSSIVLSSTAGSSASSAAPASTSPATTTSTRSTSTSSVTSRTAGLSTGSSTASSAGSGSASSSTGSSDDSDAAVGVNLQIVASMGVIMAGVVVGALL